MFTGIIQALGSVRALEFQNGGAILRTDWPFANGGDIGESVAINGVCLTLDEYAAGAAWDNGAPQARFRVGPATLEATNLRSLVPGSVVHLERALRASDRLSGHFVQGHVDGCAEVVSIKPAGEAGHVWMELSGLDRSGDLASWFKYTVPKGSIAVDGVSLTIAERTDTKLTIMLVPHTVSMTRFSRLAVPSWVNIEVDILAKYIWQFQSTLSKS